MPRGDFTQAQFNAERFVESSLEHPDQFSAPPLAPTESAADADILLQLEALARISRDEHSFQPPKQNDLLETETSFGSRRKLIAGTAIVLVLGAGALAYFLLPSADENTATQTVESAPTVQPSPVAPVQAATSVPEPSPAPSNSAVVALPDLPSSVTFDPAPELAAAPPANTATRQTVPASENRDTVLLQRPGVNIRSMASANGPVLGTAPKGTRFRVTSRDGDWVQVESSRLKGWINSQFLAPDEPR
jgi:Bacterial SH3 domain